jgi:hypothetical protein
MTELLGHFEAAWYHGTHREFEPGDMVEPGHPSNYGLGPEHHVYFNADPDTASLWAGEAVSAREQFHGETGHQPHVYEVALTHPDHEPDPEVELEWDRRTRFPVRVVREVPHTPRPRIGLLQHFTAVGGPAVPEEYPNPYHGTRQFGGNPEWSHTWFHGTRGADPDLKPGRPLEERAGAGTGMGWPQPNKLLGTHFTPLHRVAHRFAAGVYPSRVGAGSPGIPSALVHASLHFRNPAHFETEGHLNLDIARWAQEHYPDWHDDKLNSSLSYGQGDPKEAPFKLDPPDSLLCTPTGQVADSLGGETVFTPQLALRRLFAVDRSCPRFCTITT